MARNGTGLVRRTGVYALATACAMVAIGLALPLARGETVTFALVPLALSTALSVWLAVVLLAYRAFRALQHDRTQRLDAQRAAAQADRVASLTAALGQARTTRTAIEAALQEPMFALQADAGALLLISRDGEHAEVARAVGYPHQGYPPGAKLSSKNPLADAVGRGAPVIIETREAWAADYPDDTVLARGLFEAALVVPLLIGSRVVAVVRLEFRNARAFTADDREYLHAVGTRAAQALDRTHELEAAEQARSEAETLRAQADRELIERKGIEGALRTSETRYRALAARTTRLYTLARALSEAATVEAVTRAVVDHGRTVAGATVVEVLLQERDEGFEPGLCAAEAVRTGQPIFVKSFAEWQERFPQSASFAADGGYESSAILPLLAEGTAFGVVAFHFTVPVNFDEEYQTLLMSVAGHCEQALERARLYEATERAKAEAEQANRGKDEFVSIVSHELRTPLSAILGWATMLKRGTLEGAKAERALQSICDNASRQSKLIDELLDFSRVTSGRVAIDMDTIEIRDVIRGVVESMIPAASARGIQLELSSIPPAHVSGDIRRLEQVFFNLIENALKFTPNNGHIGITVRVPDGHVEVAVTDDGPGISPEFLPHVFDRFRQADRSTHRNYGGLGLGLSIAQQLVHAHHGVIGAESPGLGQGSTFKVTLPTVGPTLEETVSRDEGDVMPA